MNRPPRRVRCLDTDQKWDDIHECAAAIGVGYSTLNYRINSKMRIEGALYDYITGEIFIRCIETGELFENRHEIASAHGVKPNSQYNKAGRYHYEWIKCGVVWKKSEGMTHRERIAARTPIAKKPLPKSAWRDRVAAMHPMLQSAIREIRGTHDFEPKLETK